MASLLCLFSLSEEAHHVCELSRKTALFKHLIFLPAHTQFCLYWDRGIYRYIHVKLEKWDHPVKCPAKEPKVRKSR